MTILTSQILWFSIGSIILIYAGKQDKQTRRPLLLIPALLFISLSANPLTFLLTLIASGIIFFAPNKINKLMGKADLLLFTTILIIIIIGNNYLLGIILWLTLLITTINIYKFYKKTENKKKTIPLISYFTTSYSLVIITVIIASLMLTLIKGV